MADNIIVATGPGVDSQVTVYSSELPDPGTAPEVFSAFTPYPGSKSGVALSTGLVDAGSGRHSIVTAPGPGEPARIKTFRYDLFTPTARAQADGTAAAGHHRKPNEPEITSEFLAFDEAYIGGATLATGWVAGAEGGAQEHRDRTGRRRHRAGVVDGIAAGRSDRRCTWTVPTTTSRPSRSPRSPRSHRFPEPQGVTVATTSTTTGADLLVSAAAPNGSEVRKFDLVRAAPDAKTLAPRPLATLRRDRGTHRGGTTRRAR